MEKKKMKTLDAVSAYNTLAGAKLNKLEDAEKFAVVRSLIGLKPVKTAFDDMVKDAYEKLKGDDHDEMQRKADDWNAKYQGKNAPAPDEAALAERRVLNEYFEAYRKRVDDCIRPASEKAVEVEVELLSQEAFGRLLASNPEWAAQDAMRAMETIVGN